MIFQSSQVGKELLTSEGKSWRWYLESGMLANEIMEKEQPLVIIISGL